MKLPTLVLSLCFILLLPCVGTDGIAQQSDPKSKYNSFIVANLKDLTDSVDTLTGESKRLRAIETMEEAAVEMTLKQSLSPETFDPIQAGVCINHLHKIGAKALLGVLREHNQDFATEVSTIFNKNKSYNDWTCSFEQFLKLGDPKPWQTAIATIAVLNGAIPIVTDTPLRCGEYLHPLDMVTVQLSLPNPADVAPGGQRYLFTETCYPHLSEAVRNGNEWLVRLLLGLGHPTGFSRHYQWSTPLHDALTGRVRLDVCGLYLTGIQLPWNISRDTSLTILKLLLANGEDPNCPDRHGAPPLVSAVRSGDPARVEVLLDFGATVNTTDAKGLSALAHTIGAYSIDKTENMGKNAEAYKTIFTMLVKEGASTATVEKELDSVLQNVEISCCGDDGEQKLTMDLLKQSLTELTNSNDQLINTNNRG